MSQMEPFSANIISKEVLYAPSHGINQANNTHRFSGLSERSNGVSNPSGGSRAGLIYLGAGAGFLLGLTYKSMHLLPQFKHKSVQIH
jgi:hypothetical protein